MGRLIVDVTPPYRLYLLLVFMPNTMVTCAADKNEDMRKRLRNDPAILPRQVHLLVSRFLGFYQRSVYKLMNDA